MTALDENFEKLRLKQLVQQLDEFRFIEGKVVFGCLPDSSQIDFSSWLFPSDQQAKLKSSDLKYLLQPLIESIAQYRQKHNVIPNKDCLAMISNNQIQLTWLIDNSAELLISQLESDNQQT